MIDRGVDDHGAEGVGKPERLDAVLPVAGHLDQRQLALQRAAVGSEVSDRMHRHHALELVLDLRSTIGVPVVTT